MNNIIKKIMRTVKYWGYTECGNEFFGENKEFIAKTNMETMKKFSIVISIVLCIFIILALPSRAARERIDIYILFSVCFLIFHVICSLHIKMNILMGALYYYVFSGLLFILGLIIGCNYGEMIPAVMFPVLLVVTPMMLIVQPIYLIGYSMIYLIIFCVVSYNTKNINVFEIDLLNAASCLILGTVAICVIINGRVKEMALNIKLKSECNGDELTGIHNRRDFNEYIKSIFENERPKEVSIMLTDLDDFKEYNNIYGIISGDRCLEKVGALFADFSEKHDCYVARYSGAKFIVVDEHHSNRDFEAMAAELIESVELLSLENVSSKYQTITMSGGIASGVLENATSYAEVINLADDALYQSKLNGKNMYMIAQHRVSI